MYRTVFSKNKWLLLLPAVLLHACTVSNKKQLLPYYNTPDFTPVFIDDPREVADSVTHHINDFSFINQDGKTITQKNIEGKIHIANFIFTSCGSICPVMTGNLATASDRFNADSNVVFLSFSVTPWIDSVPVLKRYQENNNIHNANWHFLTGDKAEIYSLARTGYFAEEDLGFTKDSTEFLHTEHILLIDQSKRIRGIYNGTLKLDIEQLIKDIEILQME